MKSQISASLDAVSRALAERISYPYLAREGQLEVYRRVRNRDYRKLGKRELREFYGFVTGQGGQDVGAKDRTAYLEQLGWLGKVVRDLGEVFAGYSKAVEGIDSGFNT